MVHPIVQPACVQHAPALSTPIYPIPQVPQPSLYATPLDPVFVDHVSRHMNQRMLVVTTAGQVEGLLTGVAVDHIQLSLAEGKAAHIRIAQIVYFEGSPISYK